ncbi:MAG TPA: ElyC/SanA/YdcF family protein [Anaerolineaceae bacterium]|nr:ElyC/SanA/YdcF family protein [Anaerolineaceae bacterium]
MFWLILSAFLVLSIPRIIAEIYAGALTFASSTLPDIPTKSVAIVFGAGLYRDGSPTPVLRDRVATAVELYQSGKVQKLLMSGDNRYENYNEPAAMSNYAIQLGVPAEDIVLDYAGQRTYDTCYRARDIFGITDAILVTQRFHMPRALLICNALGVNSVGVLSDRRAYTVASHGFWHLRELPATLVAMVDIWITHPEPILGNSEPIFPESTEP